jgi:2-C-methyl-D-erythritol 4-phosphate cytidylyltransferase/2-C-methyl-D-erythritol 2,4-cyclodiphosphate synthase
LLENKRIAVIVVAGGEGSRARGGDLPKQYRSLAGVPLLARTIRAFLEMDAVDAVLPVIGANHVAFFEGLDLAHPKLKAPVFGGDTRQGSSRAGLVALQEYAPDIVLIHDAARPFVTQVLLEGVVAAINGADGALPVTEVIDTIKRSTDGRTVGGTEDRTQLYAAQTPQGFLYPAILDAHKRAEQFSDSFTDDASIAEWAHLTVALAKGDAGNIKLTLPGDFDRAEAMLRESTSMETRTGSGYDVHRLAKGDHLMLGGVRIAHDMTLDGHSDADVGLHALTDALLGALGEGDIGTHFPPSDPQWKGAESHVFLRFAARRVVERGGRIVNLDLTFICEAPKIEPHVKAMRARIGEIAGIGAVRVGVKATTNEQLGFLGRREGIAALAVASVELPPEDE